MDEKRRLWMEEALTVPETLLHVGTSEGALASIADACKLLGENIWGSEHDDYNYDDAESAPDSFSQLSEHGDDSRVLLATTCGLEHTICTRLLTAVGAEQNLRPGLPFYPTSGGNGIFGSQSDEIRIARSAERYFGSEGFSSESHDDIARAGVRYIAGFSHEDDEIEIARGDAPAYDERFHGTLIGNAAFDYWANLITGAHAPAGPLAAAHREITRLVALHGEAGHVLAHCAAPLGLPLHHEGDDPDRAAFLPNAHAALRSLGSAASATAAAEDLIRSRSTARSCSGSRSVVTRLVDDAKRDVLEARCAVERMQAPRWATSSTPGRSSSALPPDCSRLHGVFMENDPIPPGGRALRNLLVESRPIGFPSSADIAPRHPPCGQRLPPIPHLLHPTDHLVKTSGFVSGARGLFLVERLATAERIRAPPTVAAAGQDDVLLRSSGLVQGEASPAVDSSVSEEVPASAIMAEDEIGHWVSKDHFAAKRRHALAADLDGPKRRIIAEQSAFRALLDVSPFNIHNALIDFVASHTSPGLREFKFHKKRIVSTKEMVRKVFGIRCGERLVVQKKGEHPELRQMYIEEGQSRPFIQHAVKLLKTCDVTDDLTIIRTWDLICLATVIDPGSANLLSLDYLDYMLDPRRTHEFSWDEYLLELAMQEVTKINSKTAEAVVPGNARKHEFWITGPFALLDIIYMDHLDFPPNQHTINYSIPRVCFVTSKDFKFIVLNDADRKILNNKTVFGRRLFLDLSNTPYGVAAFVNHHVEEPVEHPVEEPEVNPSASLNEWLVFPSSQDLEVPAAYKHLYEKHRTIYGGDVDTTLKKFGVGLKQMQSQRMAALLIDIDAAMKEGDGPSVHFPTGGGVEDETMDAADGHEDEGTANQADEETPEDDSEGIENDEVVVEANAADMDIHTLVMDIPQSAVLLDSSTGGADVGEQVAVNSPVRSPMHSPYSLIPEGICVEAWNRAPDPLAMDLFSQDPYEIVESKSLQHITIPAEEISLPTDVASVVKLDDASSKQPKAMEATTPPIPSKDAEADHLGENVSPQHPTNTDVVTKDASAGAKTVEKKTRYKRAAKGELSPPLLKKIKGKLAVETSTFDPVSVMKEFKFACSKFKALKDDMFSNFIRTANESKVSWVDFGKFKQITPDHPQQDTLFDCGFYSVLYMEHFNGKVMPNFESDANSRFSKGARSKPNRQQG
ncbi:hypothetical protein ACQ4PT_046390 [Festuca glaucescens]